MAPQLNTLIQNGIMQLSNYTLCKTAYECLFEILYKEPGYLGEVKSYLKVLVEMLSNKKVDIRLHILGLDILGIFISNHYELLQSEFAFLVSLLKVFMDECCRQEFIDEDKRDNLAKLRVELVECFEFLVYKLSELQQNEELATFTDDLVKFIFIVNEVSYGKNQKLCEVSLSCLYMVYFNYDWNNGFNVKVFENMVEQVRSSSNPNMQLLATSIWKKVGRLE